MILLALLSLRNSSFLKNLLIELEKINCLPKCIFFDSKKLSQNHELLSKNIIYVEENKGKNYCIPTKSNLIYEIIRKIVN